MLTMYDHALLWHVLQKQHKNQLQLPNKTDCNLVEMEYYTELE